ncbi:MAG: ATP-binding protein [Saprospiraceae bacterium]|nr:ATP-binding protein [Saprospiraceae bacterium]
MKTAFFYLFLFMPLLLTAQNNIENPKYNIIHQGEFLLQEYDVDTALYFAKSILSHKKITPIDKCQALLVKSKALFLKEKIKETKISIEESIALSDKLKDEYLLLKSIIVLSATLGEQQPPNLDSAALLLQTAIQLSIKTKDTLNLAKCYINTANVLFLKQDYDKALFHNELCEKLLENSNFKYQIAQNLQSKGNSLFIAHENNGNKELLLNAKKNYEKAIEIYREIEAQNAEAQIRTLLGNIYLLSDDYNNAENEYMESIRFGLALEDTSLLINGYYGLSNLYELQKKYPKANESLGKLLMLVREKEENSDIVFIKDQFSNKQSALTALIKYTIEKNDIGEEIKNKDRRLKQEEKEKGLLFFGLVILMIMIAFSVIYFQKQRKLAAKKHQLLLEELESTLKTQEINYTRAKLEGAEESRQRIVRKIHDGVGGLLINTRWSLESTLIGLPKAQQNVAEQLYENLKLQEKSYLELRRAMHELEREDTDWWDDLRQLYEKIGAEYATKIRFYTYNLGENAKGKVGEEARMVVQEIITNAIKHAKAREINIQINNIEEVLVIIIQDDGIGFDPQQTQEGMGLRNLKERIQKLGGTFDIDSGRGAGATFFIDIPLPTPENLKENPLLYGVN